MFQLSKEKMKNIEEEQKNDVSRKTMTLNPLSDVLKNQIGKLKKVPKVQKRKEINDINTTKVGLMNRVHQKEEEEKIPLSFFPNFRVGRINETKSLGVPNPQRYDPKNPDETWNRIKLKQKFHAPISSETTTRNPDEYTRLVCISDTHSKHRNVHLPPGDILIHGGDITTHGETSAINDLCKYFKEYSEVFDDIICIAGNHDVTLHSEYYKKKWKRYYRFDGGPLDCTAIEASLKDACIYLRDSEYKKEIISDNDNKEKEKENVLHFYGSPWSPFFCDWAFNLDRGVPIQKVWQKIPQSTDVLITHGPPLGRGDLTSSNNRAGCFDLLVEIQNRISPPRVHVFGHIHEGSGITFDGRTLYINASNMDLGYRIKNYPVVVDIPHDKSKPAMVVPPECKIKNAEDLSRWCKNKNFDSLSESIREKADKFNGFTFGNQLFDPTAYGEIIDRLEISFDDRVKSQILQQVLFILYAESYPKE